MNRILFLTLFVLALGSISGCGQMDEARFGLERSSAMAEELQELVGVRPSVSSRWSDQSFHELRVEFATLPTGFTVDEITAAVRQLVTVHFEDEPRNLTLAFAETVQDITLRFANGDDRPHRAGL